MARWVDDDHRLQQGELTEKISEMTVQSTTVDVSELNKHIYTSFGAMTSHLSAIFEETKKGERREKQAAEILTYENLQQTIEEHNRR